MIKRIVIPVICLMLASVVVAQDNLLSLQECIDIALQNNYELRAAQIGVEAAEQDIVTARSNWLPNVNSSFQFGKYIQGQRWIKQDVPGFDPTTGAVVLQEQNVRIEQTERNSYSASVSLSQHIYDFGRTGNYIRQAKAYKQYQEYNLFNTRNLVIANVSDKYFQLLKAYKLKDVYEEAVKHAEENLDYNQTMMDVGLKSQAEIFQAKVNLGNQKTQLINQLNAMELARADLSNALGQSPATRLDIQQDGNIPAFPDYNFEKAIDIALENNEQLKAIEMNVRATEFAIQSSKARYAPRIGAYVNYYRDNDDIGRVYSTNLNEDFTARLGASIDLNIFNGLADKADIQKRKLDNELALEQLNEQKRVLITGIQEYFLMLKAFEDVIRISQENLEAYTENLRLQTEKRRVGSGTELEVMAAQVDVIQAQETLVSAEYNAKIYRAYLDAALGIIAHENN